MASNLCKALELCWQWLAVLSRGAYTSLTHDITKSSAGATHVKYGSRGLPTSQASVLCTGAAAPRFPDKPSEYQSQAEFVKWAKNTMCETDRESLMDDMSVARMQQEFARDPKRVPLVHNKVALRSAYLLALCARPWPHLKPYVIPHAH